MNANDVIEAYIDDTVRLLPRHQRNDVAIELRSLLNEELNARTEGSGRSPDQAEALALVRSYGKPNEVAARYHPAFTIIDPADSWSFMRAAIIGAVALLLLSVLKKFRPDWPGSADDLVKIGILAWLGFLVLAFGAKNWMGRRWPKSGLWVPRNRDHVNRIGSFVLVPIASAFVLLYAAPTWVLDQISGGRLDTSWAAYTVDFQRWRLPCFIGLLVGALALQWYAAIQGRWSRHSRRISIALNLALALLCLSFAVEGNIFQSSHVDQIARDVLALVAVVYVPSVGVQIYGEIGRIERPVATNKPNRPHAKSSSSVNG
jgi:hypothetical protein